MNVEFSRKDVLRFAIGLALVPIVLGMTCPNQQVITGACCVGGSTCVTGLTQADCTSQGGVWQGAGTTTCTGCTPAPVSLYQATLTSPYAAQFTPTAAGSTITVTITAPLTASRPEFQIDTFPPTTPLLVRTVANGTVTSNTAQGTFVSQGTSVLILSGAEGTGTVSPQYAVSVTQAP